MKTLTNIKKRFFWHDKIEFVKSFVKSCEKCQIAKQFGNMRFDIEEMKSILICDLFYQVALDIARPLPKTIDGNKYVFVAIDHYSKRCEAQLVKKHDALTTSKFLEDEIICRYGVPKYILTNNGFEWMKEFVETCKNYGITHSSLLMFGFSAMAWLSV
jgi:hypothetical protein